MSQHAHWISRNPQYVAEYSLDIIVVLLHSCVVYALIWTKDLKLAEPFAYLLSIVSNS